MNFIKRLVKFLILKYKFRGKVKFYLSSNIGLNSSFEGGNLIQRNVVFSGRMGFGSYLAEGSVINGEVGRFTSIGPHVRCNYGIHPYSYPFVSTSPWFYSSNPLKLKRGPNFIKETCFEEYQRIDKINNYAISVGNDCWIGEGAFIVGGVHINDGAMVLAHAVVTKDVPAFAIVGGVPAKIIGYRFLDKDIQKLMNISWWNKDISWLHTNADIFSDISQLIGKFNKEK